MAKGEKRDSELTQALISDVMRTMGRKGGKAKVPKGVANSNLPGDCGAQKRRPLSGGARKSHNTLFRESTVIQSVGMVRFIGISRYFQAATSIFTATELVVRRGGKWRSPRTERLGSKRRSEIARKAAAARWAKAKKS